MLTTEQRLSIAERRIEELIDAVNRQNEATSQERVADRVEALEEQMTAVLSVLKHSSTSLYEAIEQELPSSK